MNSPLVTGSQRQAARRPQPHQETTTSRAVPPAIFTPVPAPRSDTRAARKRPATVLTPKPGRTQQVTGPAHHALL